MLESLVCGREINFNRRTMMQITTEQLNAVAALLGTTDKNLVFSVCIKTLVDAGMDIADATDAVLGVGRFMEIANAVYEELTAK
jgi:hypothetical protein